MHWLSIYSVARPVFSASHVLFTYLSSQWTHEVVTIIISTVQVRKGDTERLRNQPKAHSRVEQPRCSLIFAWGGKVEYLSLKY